MNTRFRRMLMAATVTACSCGAWATGAQAADVDVMVKVLDWDPRTPTARPYVDALQSRFINKMVEQAWANSRERITHDVVESVSRPDLIRSGITLSEVDLKLNPSTPDPSLAPSPSDPATGHIRLFLPNNTMDFKSTYPGVPHWADPRLSASFDLTVDIELHVNGKARPPVEVVRAVAQPVNASLRARNVTASVGLSADEVIATLSGGNKLRDMITSGIEKSSQNITGDLRAFLASNAAQLSFPPGFAFNGGRMEPNRIVIAGWHLKAVPAAQILVKAHWDPKQSPPISCEDLGVKVTVPWEPALFYDSAEKFVTNTLRSTDPGSISDAGVERQCTQYIGSLAGVSGTVQFNGAPKHSTKSYHPGAQWSVHAIPENWDNPFVVGQETAAFRLEMVNGGIGDGMNAPSQAYEALTSNPIDPRARKRMNPADRVSTGALNPQPLPPGQPTPNQPSEVSQPSAATQAPGTRAGIIVIGGRAVQKQEPATQPTPAATP